MPDSNDWNRQTIEAFRANGGKVGGIWEGRPLLLLTTTGAKSGRRLTHPLMYLCDDDRLLVFASKGALDSVDLTPYFVKYGENAWAST